MCIIMHVHTATSKLVGISSVDTTIKEGLYILRERSYFRIFVVACDEHLFLCHDLNSNLETA